METLKYTCQFLLIYCITFFIGFTLASCMRGDGPIIDTCSEGGWCSNAMYIGDDKVGKNNANHVLITINLNGPGVALIKREEAISRLEEAFGFVELSLITHLESEEYPPSGDQLPEDLLED